MQQLLARSRPQLEVPADLQFGSIPDDSQTKPSSPAIEVPFPAPPPPPPTPAPTKTIAPEDKEAIRANLDSFRELANISARSAVAKHQSTKLQTVVQVKFIVLAIAMCVTVVLWIAGWFSAGSYLPYTTAAAIATMVMLADVVRTVLTISRLKSMEAAGEFEAESGTGQQVQAPTSAPEGSAGA
jgi:uncharacterized membrane protein YcjF (UPF0283 family)